VAFTGVPGVAAAMPGNLELGVAGYRAPSVDVHPVFTAILGIRYACPAFIELGVAYSTQFKTMSQFEAVQASQPWPNG
jgi:hypothetical protein